MNLVPATLVYGVSPEYLKACASALSRRHGLVGQADATTFDLSEFSRELGASIKECKPVLAALVKDAYCTRTKKGYLCAVKFSRLGSAKIGPGLARPAAIVLLDLVIKQAKAINRAPDKYGVKVVKLAVFGSYLSKKEHLGDLDIGFELATTTPGVFWKTFVTNSHRAMRSLQVKQKNLVSLHEMCELESLNTPFRLFSLT